MADTITPGDVVKLKSGGPLMTVSSMGTSDKGVQVANCCWFSEQSAKESYGTFPVHTLQRN